MSVSVIELGAKRSIDMDHAPSRQDSFHSQKDLLSPRPLSTGPGGGEKKSVKYGWCQNLKNSVKRVSGKPKQAMLGVARTVSKKLIAMIRSV